MRHRTTRKFLLRPSINGDICVLTSAASLLTVFEELKYSRMSFYCGIDVFKVVGYVVGVSEDNHFVRFLIEYFGQLLVIIILL